MGGLYPITSVAALAAVALAAPAGAGWTLLERRDDGDRLEYHLRYEPAPLQRRGAEAPWARPLREALDLPVMDYDAGAAPAEIRPRQDALLAIPARRPDDGWWFLSLPDGSSVPASATAVSVGRVRALRLSATAEAEGFDAVLVAPAAGDAPPATVSTVAPGWLRGRFLNGEEAVLTAPPAPRALVLPSGSRLVSHRTDGTVLAVANSDLSPPGTPRISHHRVVLPVGGLQGGRHWFYAPRRVTLTDRTDSVFIETGAVIPSPPMATRPAFITLSPAGSEVALTRTRRLDRNLLYERSAVLPVGERFVFHRLNRGQTREHQLVHGDRLTTTTVSATFHLLGYNQTPTSTPDHYADLRVGHSGAFARTSWQGRTAHSFSVTGTVAPLTATSIPFTHVIPAVTGGPIADQQNLDVVELSWTGFPTVDATGQIRLELPGAATPRRVTIGGFPLSAVAADIALLDVTNPHAPVAITGFPLFIGPPGSRAIEFEVPPAATVIHAQYLPALTTSSLRAPQSLPALPAAPLEGIVVRPAVYAEELAPLLAAKGLGWIELDPQAAYDNFNGGQESPEAIREALAFLLASAPATVAFPHILLVGHGTFDPRDYLGLQTAPQVPVFVEESVDSGVTIENNTDARYAFLLGGDDLPDATVGRFPAKTEAEVTIMVARALAYAASGPTLDIEDRPALFVYDDEQAFLLDADSWSVYWSNTGRGEIRVEVSPTSDGSAERAAVKAAFERSPAGVAFALYMGHGGATVWGDEQLLNNTSAAALATEGKWPIVATFTCLNGYFATPGGINRALAETLLITGPAGAAAMIAPGGVDFYQPQRNFAEEVMAQLAVRWNLRVGTVGELLAVAQLQHALDWPDEAHVRREYLIFGDPATPLFLLEPNITATGDWAVLE